MDDRITLVVGNYIVGLNAWSDSNGIDVLSIYAIVGPTYVNKAAFPQYSGVKESFSRRRTSWHGGYRETEAEHLDRVRQCVALHIERRAPVMPRKNDIASRYNAALTAPSAHKGAR